MRVLVSWGSKRGGTAGIAGAIADQLTALGVEAVCKPASEVRSLSGYDAAIIGGALYANRWHHSARRLVRRRVADLRRIPVWLFSSGPLGTSADTSDIAPTAEVAVLMGRIGAVGHKTFGGRLSADAKGFPAAAMAKTRSGDWRNPEMIRDWASGIVRALPEARPRSATDPPARSLARLFAYGAVGWALCTALMALLLRTMPAGLAPLVAAVAAPLLFAGLAIGYFRMPGARDPLPTAIAFTAIVAALDAAVAGLVQRSLTMFASVAATWLPFALIFIVTWIVGLIFSMMPAQRPAGPMFPAADQKNHSPSSAMR